MTEFSKVVELLREILAEPTMLRTLVPKFQKLVWHSEISFPTQKAEDTARNLAYDLEYYEPDSAVRATDNSYFDDDRALAEIRSALALMNADE